jgi:hypothetical protein
MDRQDQVELLIATEHKSMDKVSTGQENLEVNY